LNSFMLIGEDSRGRHNNVVCSDWRDLGLLRSASPLALAWSTSRMIREVLARSKMAPKANLYFRAVQADAAEVFLAWKRSQSAVVIVCIAVSDPTSSVNSRNAVLLGRTVFFVWILLEKAR
jgi:hypothetical protein